jgi:serine/threonine-protein kinase
LLAEIDMLKSFDHPNLPKIVDVIDAKESFVMIMDYIEGSSLSKLIKDGAQPEATVIHWGKQLCDVLHYLHTHNPPIIYRDLKPANIMLKPDGQITLIDFGTARQYKEQNLADTTCLGTVGYAAPEQLEAWDKRILERIYILWV